MFIIEGPDHIGKTQLAHSLVRKLSTDFCGHFYGHLANWPMESSSKQFYLRMAQMVKPYSVLDRFHLSEVIYGNFFRQKSRLSWAHLRMLDGLIRANAGVVLVLTGDEDFIQQRHVHARIVYSCAPLKPGEKPREPTLEEAQAINKEYINYSMNNQDLVTDLVVLTRPSCPLDLLEHPRIQSLYDKYCDLLRAYRRIYGF